jgi:predicted component of type VI protein secretion system
MLFEPQSPLTSASIRRAIFDMIQSFEPRVTVTEVAVSYNPDDNAVSVKIDFKIINTERPLTVDLVLERTR